MLKYLNTQVTFSEVPDEITLCINITGCKVGCRGCHSPYLAEDIGEELNSHSLQELIKANEGITCICFMGGDSNPQDIDSLAQWLKIYFPYKVAWYSGRQELSKDINLEWFNFVKLGSYIEELGPLNNKTTNQKFYIVEKLYCGNDNYKYDLKDITYKFWKDND